MNNNKGSEQFPSDYAGAYYGDDGYLHVNITSSENDIPELYSNMLDISFIRFHQVKYSYMYLLNIQNLLRASMTELGIVEMYTIQRDNMIYIY